MKTLITNSSNVTRGYIIEESTYKRIYSVNGKYMGMYNKKTNITYSNCGSFIGYGDQLVSLLEN